MLELNFRNRWIIFGITGLLLILASAYFFAAAMMNSLDNYRSPLIARAPLKPEDALGEPLTRRVVFVLIDALREDTALKSDVMPFFNELRRKSASATMHSRPPSYSSPGYAVLMTGAWPDISDGQPMNPEGEDDMRTWTQDNVFRSVHRHGGQTAAFAFYWFEGFIPQDTVDVGFFTHGEDAAADRDVVDAAIPWLQNDQHQFILVHLDQVDYAGHHEGGPRDPNWDAAAHRCDDLLREIVSCLDLEQDTLIVLSDHGQIDRGGHGGQDPITLIEPFVMLGAGVRPGQYSDIEMVDVAPTVTALLGVNIPAATQGDVLTEMLVLSDEQQNKIEKSFGAQRLQLLDAYSAAINSSEAELSSVAPNSKDELMTQMDTYKNGRLTVERIPRFLLAGILAFLPAILMYRKRGRQMALLLGGAVLYTILFHLVYAVIAGRTYSLSSVASVNDIFVSTALYVLISLLVSWLSVSLITGVFRKTSSQAMALTLALLYVVLYSLLLPILWNFAVNGLLITWTLPHFGSMFVGFLSVLQTLVVAVIGLLLTLAAALVARFTSVS